MNCDTLIETMLFQIVHLLQKSGTDFGIIDIFYNILTVLVIKWNENFRILLENNWSYKGHNKWKKMID